MAKNNESRVLVTLKCRDCNNANYRVSKNVKNTPDKLVLNRYCKTCRKTTEHKESK